MASHPEVPPLVPRGSIQCPHCDEVFSVKASPESTPHAALVLTLDGGGIKGYSSLIILQKIMETVIKLEHDKNSGMGAEQLQTLKKPSAYFDYIIGTSTGGLIATMLGRLDLDVDQCLREYERLGADVFAHPRRVHAHNKLWPGSKYNHETLENVIKECIRDHKRPALPEGDEQTLDAALGPWKDFKESPPEAGKHHCRSAAVAVVEKNSRAVPYLFRTYIHPVIAGKHTSALNPSNTGCSLEIWEVARATSAAPSYFKAFEKRTETKTHIFMDGGIRANNPSTIAWNEVLQMARISNPNITGAKAVGCFISIGTGKSKYQIFGREKQSALSKYLHMNSAPKKMITDTDPAHIEMQQLADDCSTPYYRFNVEEGLQSMPLDEWAEKKRKIYNDGVLETRTESTIQYLKTATSAYLESITADSEASVDSSIVECAQLLVEYRHYREQSRRRAIQGNGEAK